MNSRALRPLIAAYVVVPSTVSIGISHTLRSSPTPSPSPATISTSRKDGARRIASCAYKAPSPSAMPSNTMTSPVGEQSLKPVDSLTAVARDLGKSPGEKVPGLHMILAHRTQRYMLLRMIQALEGGEDDDTIQRMWSMWEDNYRNHKDAEDTIWFPDMKHLSADMPETRVRINKVIEELDNQHRSLGPFEIELRELMKSENLKGASKKAHAAKRLREFARKYHNHTYEEEHGLLPLADEIALKKPDEALKAGKKLGKHFSSQRELSYMLMAMGEMADASTEDKEYYEGSMPWILRGPVTWFTSYTGPSFEYAKLFPTPKGPIEQEFAATLRV